ncbi:MAG: hypothetical protein WD055_01715 [Candidatus Dependentiae bacterium]
MTKLVLIILIVNCTTITANKKRPSSDPYRTTHLQLDSHRPRSMEILNLSPLTSSSPRAIAESTPRPENDPDFHLAQMLNEETKKRISLTEKTKKKSLEKKPAAAAVPRLNLSLTESIKQCYQALAFLALVDKRYEENEQVKKEIKKTIFYISILDPSFDKSKPHHPPETARQNSGRMNYWNKYESMLEIEEKKNLSPLAHDSTSDPQKKRTVPRLKLEKPEEEESIIPRKKYSKITKLSLSDKEAKNLLSNLNRKIETNVYDGQKEFIGPIYNLIDNISTRIFPSKTPLESPHRPPRSPRLLMHIFKKSRQKKAIDNEQKIIEQKKALSQLFPVFNILYNSYLLETNTAQRSTIETYILKASDLIAHFERNDYSIIIPEDIQLSIDRCHIIVEGIKKPRNEDRKSRELTIMQEVFLETGRKLLRKEKQFSYKEKMETWHKDVWQEKIINHKTFQKAAIRLLERTTRIDDLIKVNGMIHQFPLLLENKKIQALIIQAQKKLKNDAQRSRIMRSRKKPRGKSV